MNGVVGILAHVKPPLSELDKLPEFRGTDYPLNGVVSLLVSTTCPLKKCLSAEMTKGSMGGRKGHQPGIVADEVDAGSASNLGG